MAALYRSISRDFFGDEDVCGVSPLARLLFIATWLEADREGRLVWKPRTLKLRYLPADACDVDALAAELVNAGLVIPYMADGELLAEIPSFLRLQVINNRETPSRLPARDHDAITTRPPRDSDATATRGNAITTPLAVMECNGKEGASVTRAPSDDRMPPKQSAEGLVKTQKITFAVDRFIDIASYLPAWRKAYPAVEIESEVAKAAAWVMANPKNRKSNYARFLTGWLSRAQDRAPARGSAPTDSHKVDFI